MYYYINILFRHLLPLLSIISILIIGLMPVKLPGTDFYIIFFDTIVIFYWVIYYPRLLSPPILVILGILHDNVYSTTIGITSLCYVIVQFLILSQRKIFITQPFIVIWLVFGVFSFIFILLKTTLISLIDKHLIINLHLLFQWLFISFIYPIFHILFNKIYVLLPKIRTNE